MAVPATFSQIASIAGISIQSSIVRSADTGIPIDPITPLPAAKAGTLSARTDDDTGVVTAASHGLVQNDKANVFWSGGCRAAMTVGEVSGNDVPVDGGVGDALPAQSTAVTIAKQIVLNCPDFEGNALVALAAACDKLAHMQFCESGGVNAAAKRLAPGEAWTWAKDTGVDNPLAGKSVTTVAASCGDATSTGALKVGIALDA